MLFFEVKTSNVKHEISHKLTVEISQNLPPGNQQGRVHQSPLGSPLLVDEICDFMLIYAPSVQFIVVKMNQIIP